MSPFASYASANDWKDIIASRFSPCTDERALARTGLTGAAARAALLDLELEILQHPDLLAHAKQKRNATRPACSLPPEVLTRVFALVVEFVKDTITLSHVCNAWRSITLSSSELWCTISAYTHPPRAVPTILSRCQQQKLRLTFNNIILQEKLYGPMLRSIWLTPSNYERLSCLIINDMTRDWPSLLRTPMPALEILDIDFCSSTSDEEAVFIPTMSSPRLSHLNLSGCFIPWTALLFNANVTNLNLEMPSDSLPSSLSLPSQFYNALGRMPNLKDLCLTDVFPDFANSTETTIYLQHLNCLRINATCDSMRTSRDALMTLLSFKLSPNACCEVFLEIGLESPDLVSRAVTHLFQMNTVPSPALKVGSRAIVTGDLSGLRPHEVVESMRQDPDEDETITWMKSPANREFRIIGSQSLLQLFSLVQMSSVQHLMVIADAMRVTTDANTWKDAFSSANQVDNLVLPFTPHLSTFLHALADETTDSDSQCIRMSLFPRLKVLSLCREYAFDSSRLDEGFNPVIVREGESLQLQFALLELILARQRRDVPLEKLAVEEGILDDEMLRSISAKCTVEIEVVP